MDQSWKATGVPLGTTLHYTLNRNTFELVGEKLKINEANFQKRFNIFFLNIDLMKDFMASKSILF